MGLLTEWSARAADEGDALAVGRPCRTGIVIDARCEELQTLRQNVIDADERMIAAVADERQFGSVG
jgi:hypothetical protein